MITVSEKAEKKIAELVRKNERPVKGLRVGARAQTPLKVDYRLAFVSEEQVSEADRKISFEGFDIYMDPESADLLEEAVIDYVDGLMGSGFKIDRPRKLPTNLSGPVVDRVLEVLDQQINPAVAGHGGHISLIDIKDNVVYVQLEGGCQGCGMADVTLKQGVESMIREAVPEIERVLDVTDHAEGKNPYYQSSK